MTKKNKDKDFETIRLSNIDKQMKDEFARKAHDLGYTYKELFETVWEVYKYCDFDLNKKDKENISHINNILPGELSKRLKRFIQLTRDKLDSLNSKNHDLSIKNSSKSAFTRIDLIVKEMMKNNDNSTNWFDKKHISNKSIHDYVQDKKKDDPNILTFGNDTIKKYLIINKKKVDDHNNKHDLGKNHNLKAFYYKKQNQKQQNEDNSL